MEEKLKIDRPVICEGKYDRARLLSVIDAPVFETKGFGLFKNAELKLLLRKLAAKKGVIVLTDSDGAGFVIRGHLRSVLPKDKLTHLYIPEIKGKERRKPSPSAEGLLGVEGMERDLLYRLFLPFATGAESDEKPAYAPLTKADLYAYGFSGGEGSSARRERLLQRIGLPTKMTADAMLEALNLLYTREEAERLLAGETDA